MGWFSSKKDDSLSTEAARVPGRMFEWVIDGIVDGVKSQFGPSSSSSGDSRDSRSGSDDDRDSRSGGGCHCDCDSHKW